MTDAEIIAANTSDAYMADTYGEERWTNQIQELLDAGYNQTQVEWIVRSKIARWADDAEISMADYCRSIPPTKLAMWMKG